jgi:hypothetical protein
MLVENIISNDFQSPRGAKYNICRPSGALIQNNNIISTNPDNYRDPAGALSFTFTY